MISRQWWPLNALPSLPQQVSPRTFMPADDLDWTDSSILFDIHGPVTTSASVHQPLASVSSTCKLDTSSLHASATSAHTCSTHSSSDKTAVLAAPHSLQPAFASCHPSQLIDRLTQIAPPEWVWQKHNIASLNLHMSAESSQRLSCCSSPRRLASAQQPQAPKQHCLLLQNPTIQQLLSTPLGETVRLQAVAYVCNSRYTLSQLSPQTCSACVCCHV